MFLESVFDRIYLWKRMGPGGPLGLQIRSRVVIPAEVGSTPTRFRQVRCGMWEVGSEKWEVRSEM